MIVLVCRREEEREGETGNWEKMEMRNEGLGRYPGSSASKEGGTSIRCSSRADKSLANAIDQQPRKMARPVVFVWSGVVSREFHF